MSLRGDVRASSDVDGARGGPSQAFCRVRLGPEGPVMTGTPSWRGGTPVPRADGETDGVFAGWDYDDGVVRVVIDRLAFFPLYYAAGPTEFCVSPSLVTLLEQGAPRDVDDDALAVFLRTGWFLRDDTAFRRHDGGHATTDVIVPGFGHRSGVAVVLLLVRQALARDGIFQHVGPHVAQPRTV